MYRYIGISFLNDHLGSSTDPCFIQNFVIMNRVITNHVIKRLRCTMKRQFFREKKMHCSLIQFHAQLSVVACPFELRHEESFF